jgi:uncharacterized repeat protein (TIGR03803 family)
VIFKLVPSDGTWTESAPYSFCPYNFCHGGWYPWGLTRAANGDVYSTTTYGGNFFWPCVPGDGCGAVFKFSPKSGAYVALHRFDGRDGAFPNSSVVLDQQGNVYGTTTNDGAFGCGTVFQLSPRSEGGWMYNVLYNLRGGASAGSMAIDSSGNLYIANAGMTDETCPGGESGQIFKLSPSGQAHWNYSFVHKLNSASSGLIFDKQGNLYGTAASGGTYGYGFVFEVTP